MTYRAEVHAGVDLSQAKTEVTDTEVIVTLPAVEILDISIDDDSIQYYDEKRSTSELGAERRCSGCHCECKRGCGAADAGDGRSGNDGQEQAKTLITGMLSETIGDKTLVIKFEK